MTASAATAIAPPAADEYAPYYGRYISRVPPGADIVGQLDRQREDVLARFRAVPESKGAHRYAPGKWSVRQVVCHLSDTERIMAYRALRIARADPTPLPGFDENAFAPESGADAVPLAELVAEFADVRRASLALFRHLPPDAWTRRGTASESPFSVRALAWIIVGHPIHHLDVLRERYGV